MGVYWGVLGVYWGFFWECSGDVLGCIQGVLGYVGDMLRSVLGLYQEFHQEFFGDTGGVLSVFRVC